MRRRPSYGLVHGRLRGLGDTDRKLHGARLISLWARRESCRRIQASLKFRHDAGGKSAAAWL